MASGLPNQPNKCTWHLGASAKESIHTYVKREKKPKIYPNILYGIGDTPLVRLNKIPVEYGIKCEMYTKCEFLNIDGSVKSRIALRMVEDAERKGKLKPGSVLIEPTSGNTGISIALVALVKGYRCITLIPEKVSEDKADILRALGAEVIRTPSVPFDSPDSHFNLAQKMQKEIPNSLVLNQYINPCNPLAHYDTTAEELIEQLDGKIDMIVLGAGTGGTITGIGRKIKEKCPKCKIIAVDPYGSIVAQPEYLNKTTITHYEVEGFGHDFKPTCLDRSVVDKWIKCGDKESFDMCRNLIRKEGLLCGGTSGSAVYGAIIAAKDLKENQNCVILLPDGTRNYMTKFMNDNWLIERDLLDVKSETKAKQWWWDSKVTCLNLSNPLIVLSNTSYQDAVHVMNTKRLDQLSVVDETGTLKGIVTLDNVMKKIVTGESPNSKVSGILFTKFSKVTPCTTLWKLSRILEDKNYVVVLNNAKHWIVRKIDLVNFIMSEENKTKSNSVVTSNSKS